MGAAGLVVHRIDPVVADMGSGEGDDLAGVGGIGDHLLIAGENGVEHRFAGGHPPIGFGSHGFTFEDGAVGQHQTGLGSVDRPVPAAHRWASASTTTGSPANRVCLTWPVNVHPA